MDPAQALADLTEISSQIDAAVLFDADGAVQGSTLSDENAARALAGAAGALLEAAAGFRTGGGEVTQLEASTRAGSVFAVCDGPRRIAAVTGADPTAGLVFYDLKSCLRGAGAESQAKQKRRRRTAAEPVEEGADEA
jgi:predicted regulator of Ras-like GTPase activity (Roadblock/LC7/MglB family)